MISQHAPQDSCVPTRRPASRMGARKGGPIAGARLRQQAIERTEREFRNPAGIWGGWPMVKNQCSSFRTYQERELIRARLEILKSL